MLLSFQRPSRLSREGIPPPDACERRALAGGLRSIALARRLRKPRSCCGPLGRRSDLAGRTTSRTIAAPGAEAGAMRSVPARRRSGRAQPARSGACRAAARGRRARRPGRRAARAGSGSPSSRTPPWASSAPRLRARDAERLGQQRGQVDRSPSPCASATSGISSGSSCSTKTRSKRRLGRRRRPPRRGSARRAPRASARLASRGAGAGRRAARRAAARTTCAIAASGRRSVLPYISSGGSVTPMWLPSDFDIFRSPSVPGRIGIVRTACSGWP